MFTHCSFNLKHPLSALSVEQEIKNTHERLKELHEANKKIRAETAEALHDFDLIENKEKFYDKYRANLMKAPALPDLEVVDQTSHNIKALARIAIEEVGSTSESRHWGKNYGGYGTISLIKTLHGDELKALPHSVSYQKLKMWSESKDVKEIDKSFFKSSLGTIDELLKIDAEIDRLKHTLPVEEALLTAVRAHDVVKYRKLMIAGINPCDDYPPVFYFPRDKSLKCCACEDCMHLFTSLLVSGYEIQHFVNPGDLSEEQKVLIKLKWDFSDYFEDKSTVRENILRLFKSLATTASGLFARKDEHTGLYVKKIVNFLEKNKHADANAIMVLLSEIRSDVKDNANDFRLEFNRILHYALRKLDELGVSQELMPMKIYLGTEAKL